MSIQNFAQLPLIVQYGLTTPGCSQYSAVTGALVLEQQAYPERGVRPHTVSFHKDPHGNTLAKWDGVIAGQPSLWNSYHLEADVNNRRAGRHFLTAWELREEQLSPRPQQSPIRAEWASDGVVITAPVGDFISGERAIIAGPFNLAAATEVLTTRAEGNESQFAGSLLYQSSLLLALAERDTDVPVYNADELVGNYDGGVYQVTEDMVFLLNMVLDEADLEASFRRLAIQAQDSITEYYIQRFMNESYAWGMKTPADLKAKAIVEFIDRYISDATDIFTILAHRLIEMAEKEEMTTAEFSPVRDLYIARGLSFAETRLDVSPRRELDYGDEG
ncbi:MAG: hypothetical protein ABII18_01325 [bacterium]|nr:hypothetical protein [bacterium]MBU1918906.1 hypothetical protein [bacterium]